MASSAAHRLHPASLMVAYRSELNAACSGGPALDLACGAGHNGLYLAVHGAAVRLIDRDENRLATVRSLAKQLGVRVEVDRLDLESGAQVMLPPSTYGVVLVFRYLHRPLMPVIQAAVKPGGIVVYETYTINQPKYGRPRNPAFLLKPGELNRWFEGWEMIHTFEGELRNPVRAMAQVVCRKP